MNSYKCIRNLPGVFIAIWSLNFLVSYCEAEPIDEPVEHGSTFTAHSFSARILKQGLLDCFDENLKAADGKPVYCETSAVLYDGNNLILLNDKPLPGTERSPVFSISYASILGDSRTLPHYFTNPVFGNAVKYEAITMTPDGKYVIATTAFDRIKPNSSEWNGYNTLLFWPMNQPDKVKVVSPVITDAVKSSVVLREKLSKAIKTSQYPEGAPYFKIEGLAALPPNRLLFGVREIGRSFQDYQFSMLIIAVSFTIENEELILGDDFKVIYEYNPSSQIKEPVGLSSLEYDKYNNRLYILTSFEQKEGDQNKLGGYLWILSLSGLDAQQPPQLVYRENGPLRFSHKPEGPSILDSKRIIVIHDDDRETVNVNQEDGKNNPNRKPNQVAFDIVEITELLARP